MPRSRKTYRTDTDKQLQAARAKAQRKVNYWAKQGVDLGKKLPSRGDVSAMSGSQKLAEIRALNAFRSTDFGKAGKQGALVPRDVWRSHERARAKVNSWKEKRLAKFGHVALTQGGTVEDHMTQLVGSRWDKRMSAYVNTGSPEFYAPSKRSIGGYPSQWGIKRQTEHWEKQLEPYMQHLRAMDMRKNAAELLRNSNMNSVADRVENMTDDQIDVLMNMTPFMHNVKMKYEQVKGRVSASVGNLGQNQADQLVDDVIAQVK